VFKAILGFFRRSGNMAAAGKRAAQAGAVKAAGTHSPGAQAEVTQNARDVEKALFFKSFPRPKIIALRASEVDHNAAKAYADKARRFFAHPVNLFNQNSVFYEESEASYIESIYGNEARESAISSETTPADEKLKTIDEEDRYYVGTLTRMRHTTNQNTGTYFLWLLTAAMIFGFAPFFAAFIDHARGSDVFAGLQIFTDQWVLLSLIGPLLGFGFAMFSYYVSYKNQQIRNTQNFNGYIETRLNRINTIRADALKEAANAEKEKSNEAEVLTSAVDWMLCYHWMIWRSFLNEQGIRNILFQIRRNTDLYKWGSFLILLVANAGFVAASFAFDLQWNEAMTIAAASTIWLTILPYFYIFHICADPASLVERKMYASEWARFHTSGIDKGLEDQIRRDKGEILHYRNRLKNENF